MPVRKSPAQIATMRKAGRVVAEMHDRIRAALAAADHREPGREYESEPP